MSHRSLTRYPRRGLIEQLLRRALAPLADPLFWAALVPGLFAVLLPRPAHDIATSVLLLRGFAEELFFRAGVQESLALALGRRQTEWAVGPVTPANLLGSAVFALAHLAVNPVPMAALTFFPSLVFGWLWDRHRNVVPCWLCHFFYNICLFGRA